MGRYLGTSESGPWRNPGPPGVLGAVLYTPQAVQVGWKFRTLRDTPHGRRGGVLDDEIAGDSSRKQSDSDENTPEMIGSSREIADGGLSPASVWLPSSAIQQRFRAEGDS